MFLTESQVQVGGSVQQAQQTMDQRQDVFDELQAKLNAQNAGRQPLAVAAPPPATHSRVSNALLRTPCLSNVPRFVVL